MAAARSARPARPPVPRAGSAAPTGDRARPAPPPTPSPGAVHEVDTPAGPARITWHPAGRPRLTLALGHGAGGGIGAPDLVALAAALPARGVTIALVEQPWRVAGKRLAPAPRTLDTAWRALWPALADPADDAAGTTTAGTVPPVVAGGRSAGARVACRTAGETGAIGVLALAFPLHPPGRAERSRAGELTAVTGAGLPLLVVQGARDPFGRPQEFPEGIDPVTVPAADHAFAVGARSGVDPAETTATIVAAVADWTLALPAAT
ncbi:alpha/beta family hydrolase [Streptomyces sp. ST2-7A]|uniref:alpha/beta hydrolase family protein n=1 Tax=Streptomyces sp. ST2-7A TaxID=2907214 RepID=UPI001F2E5418|nr:alpha/beta family hydrolase [Streptomyces sp. ST2-7A]MCE7081853.1 hydrolase [Streptomyces sp. ST2-7A]